jgi:hypothetical protein
MSHLWNALCRATTPSGPAGHRGRRGIQAARAGADHRADEQAGLAARPGGGRRSRAVVSNAQPAPAGLGAGAVAAAPVGGVRRACPAEAGAAGPLRRLDSLLRGGPGRRVPRARLLQGAAPRAADHHRAPHRTGRVPPHGLRVRGQQGRDEDDAAGHREVHGRPPPARGDGRRRRGHDLGGEPRRPSRPRACRSSSA